MPKKKNKLTAADALREHKTVTGAARALGIPRTTFYSRLTSEIIDNPDWRSQPKSKVNIPVAIQRVKDGLPTAEERRQLGDFKLLMIDIETAPNLSYTWGLHDQNIGLSQLVEPSYTLCFAAKLYGAGNDEVHFHSRWDDGEKKMIRAAHKLLNEADAVVTQNGDAFDIPVLNRDFLLHELAPPVYKSIDLIKTTRSRFRFASSKLDHIVRELGFGAKVEHEGFDLWKKVMAGDKDAQGRMREYNIQDVLLLEPMYRRYRPWIRNHPNLAAFMNHDDPACTTCGGTDLQAEGYVLLTTNRRAMYRCKSCGTATRARTEKDAMPRTKVVF